MLLVIFSFGMIIGIKTVNCIVFVVLRVDNTSVSWKGRGDQ